MRQRLFFIILILHAGSCLNAEIINPFTEWLATRTLAQNLKKEKLLQQQLATKKISKALFNQKMKSLKVASTLAQRKLDDIQLALKFARSSEARTIGRFAVKQAKAVPTRKIWNTSKRVASRKNIGRVARAIQSMTQSNTARSLAHLLKKAAAKGSHLIW